MKPFLTYIQEENHKLFLRGLPYATIIVLAYTILALFLKLEQKLVFYLMGLLLFLLLYQWLVQHLTARAWMEHLFVGTLILWGIARINVSPESITAHVPLVAILFAFSALLYFEPRTSVIMNLLTLTLISISLYGQLGGSFFTYFMNYLLVLSLSTLISHFNLANRRLLFEQNQKVSEYSQELKHLNLQLSEENVSLFDVMEDFGAFSDAIMTEENTSETLFLQRIFDKLIKMVPIAQGGTIYTMDQGIVNFVACKAYDLDSLNRLKIPAAAFNLPQKNVQIVRNINQRLTGIHWTGEERRIYLTATRDIRETLIFQLELTPFKRIGVSLDLFKDSSCRFSGATVKKVEAYRALLQFYYTHRSLKSLQGELTEEIIRSLIKFLDIHDPSTKGHSVEVAEISRDLAKNLGLPLKSRETIYWAALLHDIGKLHIDYEILNKKEPLTEAEYDRIKEHPASGADALEDSAVLRPLARIIRYHHERYDGKGYPMGLKGEEIPFESRIISVADAFEAMTANRSYRKALDVASAAEELKKNAGTQFDPRVVDIMLQMIHQKNPD